MADSRVKQVFLSHTSKDKDFARRLAQDLRTAGVPVWYDEWELKVGDSLQRKIEEGIRQSGYLAVVISRHSVNSAWVQRELGAALAKELEARDVFVLPLLISHVEVPLLLRDRLYADFRGDYTEGLKRLLDRCGQTPASLPPPLPRQPAVLWIDNDAEFLGGYADALTGSGFSVDLVTNLSDAAQSLGTVQYDAVIIDMMIPTRSEDEEHLLPPRDTDFGLNAGIAFYRKYRETFTQSGTRPLFLTTRLDARARTLVEEVGLAARNFSTKMEVREPADLVGRVKALVATHPQFDSDKDWTRLQMARAHELLARNDRSAVLAGAQIVDAIGGNASLPFIAAVLAKSSPDDDVRAYLELVLRSLGDRAAER